MLMFLLLAPGRRRLQTIYSSTTGGPKAPKQIHSDAIKLLPNIFLVPHYLCSHQTPSVLGLDSGCKEQQLNPLKPPPPPPQALSVSDLLTVVGGGNLSGRQQTLWLVLNSTESQNNWFPLVCTRDSKLQNLLKMPLSTSRSP